MLAKWLRRLLAVEFAFWFAAALAAGCGPAQAAALALGALLGLRATFVLAAVLYVLAAAVAQWGLKPASPPISKPDFPAPRA